jgi:hypothetical protein
VSAVRIETKALRDPRFAVLGKLLGTSRFDALGRVAAVWAYCTEKQARVLKSEFIDQIAEAEGFAAHLVAAELAESSDLGVRIKGTKGRIEWYARLKRGNSKGGRARSEKAKRDRSGRFQLTSSSPPAPASALSPSPSINTNTPLTPQGVVEIWNQHRGKLPACSRLNDSRSKQVRARLGENSDPEYWTSIVREIASNPFCQGKNDRGWVATFDYLIRERTHLQISERLSSRPAAALKPLSLEEL